ncbi:MAG: hypothetical protein QOD93_5122 [Acetobacteraceae bacterium]|nr:hypothetical protein [Acetobacteraceae bacterium]
MDGLPAGMMLIGKLFDQATIYRAAAAFERGVDWKTIKGRSTSRPGRGWVRDGYKCALASIMWMPLLPSTNWVTRRLPASEHSI